MSNIKSSTSKSKGKGKEAVRLDSDSPPPREEVPPPGDESESEEEDSDSADSEDLEDVEPRKRSSQGRPDGLSGQRSGGQSSKQLPRYKPPPGLMPLEVPVRFAESAFEFDAMASKPGMQLWAIRAPQDLKPSRLSALNIFISSAGPSGTLSTKSGSTYSLRSAGKQIIPHASVDEEGRQPTAGPGIADAMAMDTDGGDRLKFEGGAEMSGGMGLMVPRVSHGGKLFPAPLPISRHLILAPNPESRDSASLDNPLPSLLATSALDNAIDAAAAEGDLLAPPVKRTQPIHLLKFRNHAIGSNTSGPRSTNPLFLLVDPIPENVSVTAVKETSPVKKKRKSEVIGGEPGKKKKAKV